MGKLLNTERAGSDFGREVVRIFFLKVTKNTDLKGKIYVGKHAILSHFLMVKIPGQSTPAEANSRRCSSLNCPVERLKFFCMFLAC